MTAQYDSMPVTDGEAQAIEAAAAEWFGRRHFWNWTQDEEAALDAWLNQSLAHKVAYWRLAAAWQRTDRLKAIPHAVAQRSSPVVERRSPRLLRLGLVAAALIVMATSVGTYLSFGDNTKLYSTGIGESRTINLADGSRVELNTDTVLETDLTPYARNITLEKGEAYFQVRHDASHPFVVKVAGHRITDLGTKFTIRRDGDRIQVVLVEGKARLETAPSDGIARAATLSPGEIANAAPGTLSIRKPAPAKISNILAWRSGVLVFDDKTLGQAAAEFNRYNRIKLVIDDPSVARTQVAGKFPTDGVDRFADVVRHVFGLRVRTERDTMVITR